MRWIFIVLLMCNGIYFLWQNYLVQNVAPAESAAIKQVPQGVTPLVLLSERPDMEKQARTDRATASSEKPAASPAPGQAARRASDICWQIGPFKEEVSGKQVVSRLAAMDIKLKLQTLEIPDKPNYWVLIPPQGSRRAALKLLRELQSKRVDSFLITEGDMKDGISLGVFTQKDRAEKVYKKRQRQGYLVQLQEIPRTHTELWAVFDEGQYGKLSDALWQKITEGNQGLERRKNYCDKIASTGNFD